MSLKSFWYRDSPMHLDTTVLLALHSSPARMGAKLREQFVSVVMMGSWYPKICRDLRGITASGQLFAGEVVGLCTCSQLGKFEGFV
jgi:hypothetical protein